MLSIDHRKFLQLIIKHLTMGISCNDNILYLGNINIFLIFQMTKHFFAMVVVSWKFICIQAEISGDLGLGWHFVAKDISLKDLEPTRMPRQIIGSR